MEPVRHLGIRRRLSSKRRLANTHIRLQLTGIDSEVDLERVAVRIEIGFSLPSSMSGDLDPLRVDVREIYVTGKNGSQPTPLNFDQRDRRTHGLQQSRKNEARVLDGDHAAIEVRRVRLGDERA